MSDWENLYNNKGQVQKEPSEQVIQLVPKLEKQSVEKILDHGCGTGRHVKYLAENGFQVSGLDHSETAIKKAEEVTSELNNTELVKSEMDSLPFSDSCFDAVISIHVIQHALEEERKDAFKEIKRILKPNGLFFLRTISRNHRVYGEGKKIEPHTFINISKLPDGNTPHHYFSKEELKKHLGELKIIKFEHHSFPPEEDSIWDYGLEEWAILAKQQ